MDVEAINTRTRLSRLCFVWTWVAPQPCVHGTRRKLGSDVALLLRLQQRMSTQPISGWQVWRGTNSEYEPAALQDDLWRRAAGETTSLLDDRHNQRSQRQNGFCEFKPGQYQTPIGFVALQYFASAGGMSVGGDPDFCKSLPHGQKVNRTAQLALLGPSLNAHGIIELW